MKNILTKFVKQCVDVGRLTKAVVDIANVIKKCKTAKYLHENINLSPSIFITINKQRIATK